MNAVKISELQRIQANLAIPLPGGSGTGRKGHKCTGAPIRWVTSEAFGGVK